MRRDRYFESASYIGIRKNDNQRISLPWASESVVDGRAVRWSVQIRAGKTLSISSDIQHKGRWLCAVFIEETAYQVHRHPTEAAAFQVDRAIGAMLEYLVSTVYWRKETDFTPAPRLLEV